MSSVLIERKGSVARLILNRPEKLNVLDLEMMSDLSRCTEELKVDKEVRCVIVSGAGDHFMAGGDIDFFKTLVDTYETDGKIDIPDDMFDILHQAILNITQMDKPVIASVQGAVAGFGLSLMLACDMVLAAESTVLSVAYKNIGTTPDGGMTYLLPRAVGHKKAMELALTGRRFSAAEAEKWGMLNAVVADQTLNDETNKLAQTLADGPGEVLARTKKLLNTTFDCNLGSRLDEEAENFLNSIQQNDFTEGVRSFCERRAAKFNQ